MLHLGPLNSSFLIVINRRVSKRIRADERPDGRDNLSVNVRIGNELAQGAVALVRGFQLEQRASSLMLHLPSLKELLVGLAIFKMMRCICLAARQGCSPQQSSQTAGKSSSSKFPALDAHLTSLFRGGVQAAGCGRQWPFALASLAAHSWLSLPWNSLPWNGCARCRTCG